MSKVPNKVSLKQVFCEVCKCYIPSASLVSSHEKGKKHQFFISKKERRKKTLDCSVYIRGFKKDSNIEDDLKRLLVKYGSIKDVYVDKEKGQYSIVEFETEDAVHRLLNDKAEHVINGHKLVVRPRRQKDLEHSDVKNEVKSVTSQEVSPILEAIRDLKTLSQQMIKLVEYQELTAKDLELRKTLCELLQTVFKEVYEDCTIVPFGSTTSKLGCKGCDLDLTLITEHLGDYLHKKQPNISDTLDCSKDVSNSSNSSFQSNKDINEVCKILQKFVPGCINVFPLKSAHCPVIKFQHKDSSLMCDLSINNRLAVRNSDLLRYYCDVDDRFRCLSYTIRVWAISKGLAGKGGLQLTKYALTLLLIHYLQQCQPPVLPCLQESGKKDIEKCVIDGWDCHYDKSFVPDMGRKNSASMGELLHGFFKYFTEFDWDENVILISTSQIQTKECFLASLELDSLKEFFKVGPVCMPDPFECTHNVAQNLTNDGLEHFKMELCSSLQKITQDLEADMGTDLVNDLLVERGEEMSQKAACNDSLIKYDRINLPKLLEPKSHLIEKEKRKKPKVKYIFDVYNAGMKTSEKVCQHCADIASAILMYDLKMQCNIIHNCRNEQGTIVSTTKQELTKQSAAETKSTSIVLNRGNPNEHSINLVNDELVNTSCTHGNGLDLSSKDKVSISVGRKRSSTTEIDILPRPSKILCVGVSAPMPVNENITNHLDNVQIRATAWANTWTKRRQQKRMLKTLREDDVNDPTEKVGQHFVNTSSPLEDAKSSSANTTATPGQIESAIYMPVSSSVADASSLAESSSGTQGLAQIKTMESACDTNANGPVVLADIKIAVNEQAPAEPKCRIIVKLKEARTLADFHSFFAFFKKSVLDKMKQ